MSEQRISDERLAHANKHRRWMNAAFVDALILDTLDCRAELAAQAAENERLCGMFQLAEKAADEIEASYDREIVAQAKRIEELESYAEIGRLIEELLRTEDEIALGVSRNMRDRYVETFAGVVHSAPTLLAALRTAKEAEHE